MEPGLWQTREALLDFWLRRIAYKLARRHAVDSADGVDHLGNRSTQWWQRPDAIAAEIGGSQQRCMNQVVYATLHRHPPGASFRRNRTLKFFPGRKRAYQVTEKSRKGAARIRRPRDDSREAQGACIDPTLARIVCHQ